MKFFARLLVALLIVWSFDSFAASNPKPFTYVAPLVPGHCLQAGSGINANSAIDAGAACGGGGGGGPVPISGIVGDWAYVAGSATGTGTNNSTALNAATAACAQGGTNDLYVPPGQYYIATTWVMGACDTSITFAAGAAIRCNNGITCVQWQPTFGSTRQSIAGIIEGFVNSNGSGWTPTTAGSGCEVNDLLTLADIGNNYQRTIRQRAIFQVASCTGSAVATLNTVYGGDYLSTPGATVALKTLSGTTTGVSTTNLTWTAAPAIGNATRTEIVLNGPNALTEGGTCTTLSTNSQIWCQGDKLKIVSVQQVPWQYSTALRNIKIVNATTGDLSYGPIVAAGGTGYTVGDVLTLLTLTSPVAKGALGMPVQLVASTPATVTVASVTASGAITGLTTTTQGVYDHISYQPVPLTGGTGSGATGLFSFTATGAAGFGETFAIAQVIDATHILADRILYYPHVMDSSNPPQVAKLPNFRFVLNNASICASGQEHNTAYSGRVPAGLRILGAVTPQINAYRSCGQWERMIEEHSTWHGHYYMISDDAVDMPTQSGYGYGFSSFGGSEGADVQIVGGMNRHGVSAGAYPQNYATISSNFAVIGGTFDALVHDSNFTGTHISGFDTHEDGGNWTFMNDSSVSDTADPNDTTAVSTGLVMRGWNNTNIGFHSFGNLVCIEDDSQRFPFSGIFYQPSLTRSINMSCDGGAYQVGGVQTARGYALIGETVDNTWGSHDPFAVSQILGGSISSQQGGVSATEGANRFDVNGVYFTNIPQVLQIVGPTDFSMTNSVINNMSTFFTSSQTPLTQRSNSTHYTGTNVAIFSNNTLMKSTQAATPGTINPRTWYSNLDTTGGNSTTLYSGNEQIVNGNLSTSFFSNSGGGVTLVNTNYNPLAGNGIQKVTATAVSMAATGDAATVPIPSTITKYRVLAVDVGNCSASLATAQLGVWSAASKGGTNVAANQSLTACTSTTTNQALTLAAGAGTVDLTAANLFVNVGVLQSSPTADVTIWLLDKSTH